MVILEVADNEDVDPLAVIADRTMEITKPSGDSYQIHFISYQRYSFVN